MKKIINGITYFVVSLTLLIPAYAQVSVSNRSQQAEPKILTDLLMRQILQSNFEIKNSYLSESKVSWYDTGDGYYGTYSSDCHDYMIRYDRNGHLLETMTKRTWNDQVPSHVRSSFDQSPYKTQKVTSYWETSGPGKEGYTMELRDSDGTTSTVWADKNGRISNQSYANRVRMRD